MSERAGYEQAIFALRGVYQRSGSPAARWAAEYLAADPDRLGPPGGHSRECLDDYPAPCSCGYGERRAAPDLDVDLPSQGRVTRKLRLSPAGVPEEKTR